MRLPARALLLALVLHAPRALADSDPALAETLFQKGRDLMKQGSTAEACTAFAESHKLDPKTGTLANLAACHEKQGLTATAWAEFTTVVQQANRLGQTDREDFARAHAKELEGRLSRVTIIVKPTAGLELRLGDRVVPESAYGTSFPVDPGSYAVVAAAKGHATWRGSAVVPEGPSQQTIEVPALQRQAEPPATRSQPPSDHAAVEVDGGRKIPGLTWVVAGVGVAAAGVGTFFGLQTFDKRDEGNALCRGRACSQEGLDLHREAEKSADLSTIAFSIAAAAAIGTVVLILTAPRTTRPMTAIAF